ncbi:hypothetical protein GW17_00033711 [Ensete ventricosum]|nr:hypothetical protein GW17_00033711 [Ensete ventricosum]RZR76926.1 hypothetical protein BHM03_00001837 [Ensete ventricosum]
MLAFMVKLQRKKIAAEGHGGDRTTRNTIAVERDGGESTVRKRAEEVEMRGEVGVERRLSAFLALVSFTKRRIEEANS